MCVLLNSYSVLQRGFHIIIAFSCEYFKLDESQTELSSDYFEKV